jgi:hypothetical protein
MREKSGSGKRNSMTSANSQERKEKESGGISEYQRMESR